jgi:hypothetical protein
MYVGMCTYICVSIYVHIYVYTSLYTSRRIAGVTTCAQLRDERRDRMFTAFDAYLDESADYFGAEELAMRKASMN